MNLKIFLCVKFLSILSVNMLTGIDLDSALIKAVKQNNLNSVNLVKKLLSQGANPNAKGEVSEDDYALYNAVYNNNLRIVKELINAKADTRIILSFGGTLLHLAAEMEESSTDILQLLVESGININITDYSGKTVLDILKVKPSLGGHKVIFFKSWQVGIEKKKNKLKEEASKYLPTVLTNLIAEYVI